MPAPEQPHTRGSETSSERSKEPWWRTQLPFAPWWPIVAGACAGLVLRFVFSGKPTEAFTAMNGAFVFLAPMVVGAFTVYVAETKQRRRWSYYIGMPVLANVLFVVGTMAVMIEGLICAVIILPLFCVLGGVAGLGMGAMCRWTNWPKQAVYSFALLPLILAPVVHGEPPPRPLSSVSRSIEILSPPSVVWPHLLNATDIKPEEVGAAWMYRIGVPLPVSGVSEQTTRGMTRHVIMGKAIHFDQISTDWREHEYVRWRYEFGADSFPPRALDDHVVIGGRFFDLVDTVYTLEPIGSGATRLTIQMRYRVSTQFNLYADSVAKLLIGDFEEVILAFYAKRSTGG